MESQPIGLGAAFSHRPSLYIVVCPVSCWFWLCFADAGPQTSTGFACQPLGFCLTLVWSPNLPCFPYLGVVGQCPWLVEWLSALLSPWAPSSPSFAEQLFLLLCGTLADCQPVMDDACTGFTYGTPSAGAKKFHQQVENTSQTRNQGQQSTVAGQSCCVSLQTLK